MSNPIAARAPNNAPAINVNEALKTLHSDPAITLANIGQGLFGKGVLNTAILD